jgi:hypothetical protein
MNSKAATGPLIRCARKDRASTSTNWAMISGHTLRATAIARWTSLAVYSATPAVTARPSVIHRYTPAMKAAAVVPVSSRLTPPVSPRSRPSRAALRASNSQAIVAFSLWGLGPGCGHS